MTRNANREESSSNDAEEESRPSDVSRWTRLRDFVLSRSKGKKERYPEDRTILETARNHAISRSSRLRDPATQKMETNGNANGFGGASKSLRNLKKTKTFSIFGTRKGKATDAFVEEPQHVSEQEQLRLKRQPSSDKSNNQDAPNKECSVSSQKMDRLRWVRESNANRTMIFSGDLPPNSPLSTKPLHSGETETSKSRKSDASETEGVKMKKNVANEPDYDSQDTPEVHDSEPSGETNLRSGSKTRSLRKTLLNMRIGSIVVDDAHPATRLLSSPLASPRRMHRRSSSLPDYLGRSVKRSSSSPRESGMGTGKGVSDDYESPWGVKDTSETDGETENRYSSRSFRVSEFVQGFKARKQAQSSSNNLSLTDDDESQEADGTAEPVDMFEDDFVDYSTRHIQKAQGHKTFRARRRKGMQTFTQMQ